MAQVFIPENPREREQLQQGNSIREQETHPQRRAEGRRFGGVDVLLLIVALAAITLLVLAASRWTAPLTPSFIPDLSPTALPA